jgi:hypothetical protein
MFCCSKNQRRLEPFAHAIAGGKRRAHGDPQLRRRGDYQHDEQEGQRDDGAVGHMQPVGIDRRHGRDASEADAQAG